MYSDLFRNRCPISETKQLLIKAGTDIGAGNGVAGTVIVVGSLAVMLVNSVGQDSNNKTTADVNAAYFVPDMLVTFKANESGVAGAAVYYDAAEAAFTLTGTNLKACGFLIEDKAATTTDGAICFDGRLASLTQADVDASA